jgi:hypothetical protein
MPSISEVIKGFAGIQHLWELQETSGTTATDAITATANNGTYAGVTLAEPGPAEGTKSVLFKGPSEGEVKANTAEASIKEGTIGVLFKTTAAESKVGNLIGKFAPSFHFQQLYVGSNNFLYGYHVTGAVIYLKSKVEVTDGKWHLAVLVFSETSAALYLDGKLVEEKTAAKGLPESAIAHWYVSMEETGFEEGNAAKPGHLKGDAAYAFVATQQVPATGAKSIEELWGSSGYPFITKPARQTNKVGESVKLKLATKSVATMTGTLPAGLSFVKVSTSEWLVEGVLKNVAELTVVAKAENSNGSVTTEWVWQINEAVESTFVKKVKELSGLLAYWRLNEQEGTGARDLSGLGLHPGKYETGQSPVAPRPGEFRQNAGMQPFITNDPTSGGVLFVASGEEEQELASIAYGCAVSLPWEKTIEEEHGAGGLALWKPTNAYTIGMFLEPSNGGYGCHPWEKVSVPTIFGPFEEVKAIDGYTFQVTSQRHVEWPNEHGEEEGLERQMLMYICVHHKGQAESSTTSPVLKKVELTAAGWAEIEDVLAFGGKCKIEGANLKGGIPVGNGGNSTDPNLVRIIVKGEPGKANGEIELDQNATKNGTAEIQPFIRTNQVTKKQVVPGERYFVVIVYDASKPAKERVKYYVNGEEWPSYVQPQFNNFLWGGSPPPKEIVYNTESGHPPRLGAISDSKGAEFAVPYYLSWQGRIGEAFLTNKALAPTGTESVKTLWEAATEAGQNRPSVITEGVTENAGTTATIHAKVNPNGSNVTKCVIQYGLYGLGVHDYLNAPFGKEQGVVTLPGAGNALVSVEAKLTGLTAGALYHYRILAENEHGWTIGEDKTLLFHVGETALSKAVKALNGIAYFWEHQAPEGEAIDAVGNNPGPRSGVAGTDYQTSEEGPLEGTKSVRYKGLAAEVVTEIIGRGEIWTGSVSFGCYFKTSAKESKVQNLLGFVQGSYLPGGAGGGEAAGGGGGAGAGESSPMIYLGADSKLHLYNNGVFIDSSSTYEDGAWHLVVCVITPSSQKMYVDGKLVGENASTGGGTPGYTGLWRISWPWTKRSEGHGHAAYPGAVNANMAFAFVSNAAITLKEVESLTAAGSAPTVVTEPPFETTKTTAKLQGKINPHGFLVTKHLFEWGTTPSLGKTVEAEAPGSGTSPVHVLATTNIAIEGGKTYYYRLVAENAGGLTLGALESFKVGAQPACVTNFPSPLSTTTATFRGTVNPNGKPVTVQRFKYGTSLSYGKIAEAEPAAGEGNSEVPVHATVSGLLPNQGYHVQLIATNSEGTGEGNDVAFTTASQKGNLPTFLTRAPYSPRARIAPYATRCELKGEA